MSLVELRERVALKTASPKDVLSQAPKGLSLELLKELSDLQWRVTHRKAHAGGTSVLRYSIDGERAKRLVEKVQHLHPEARVSTKDHDDSTLTVEIDIVADGILQIVIVFREGDSQDEETVL